MKRTERAMQIWQILQTVTYGQIAGFEAIASV